MKLREQSLGNQQLLQSIVAQLYPTLQQKSAEENQASTLLRLQVFQFPKKSKLKNPRMFWDLYPKVFERNPWEQLGVRTVIVYMRFPITWKILQKRLKTFLTNNKRVKNSKKTYSTLCWSFFTFLFISQAINFPCFELQCFNMRYCCLPLI